MAQIRMTIHGMEQTLRQLARVPDVVKKHSAFAVGISSSYVAQRARALVRVDTGLLKGEIDYLHNDGALTGFVGVRSKAAYYWYFVEMGYKRGDKQIPAQPYFRPAAEESQSFFEGQMRDIGPQIEHDLSEGRLT